MVFMDKSVGKTRRQVVRGKTRPKKRWSRFDKIMRTVNSQAEQASTTKKFDKASTTAAIEKDSIAQAVHKKLPTIGNIEKASTAVDAKKMAPRKAVENVRVSATQAVDEIATADAPKQVSKRQRKALVLRTLKEQAWDELGFSKIRPLYSKEREWKKISDVLTEEQAKVFHQRVKLLRKKSRNLSKQNETTLESDDDDCVLIEVEPDTIVIDANDDDIDQQNHGSTYNSQKESTESSSNPAAAATDSASSCITDLAQDASMNSASGRELIHCERMERLVNEHSQVSQVTDFADFVAGIENSVRLIQKCIADHEYSIQTVNESTNEPKSSIANDSIDSNEVSESAEINKANTSDDCLETVETAEAVAKASTAVVSTTEDVETVSTTKCATIPLTMETAEEVSTSEATEAVKKASTSKPTQAAAASSAEGVEPVSTTETIEIQSPTETVEEASTTEAIDTTSTTEPVIKTIRKRKVSLRKLRRKKLMQRLKRIAWQQLRRAEILPRAEKHKKRAMLSDEQKKIYQETLESLKLKYSKSRAAINNASSCTENSSQDADMNSTRGSINMLLEESVPSLVPDFSPVGDIEHSMFIPTPITEVIVPLSVSGNNMQSILVPSPIAPVMTSHSIAGAIDIASATEELEKASTSETVKNMSCIEEFEKASVFGSGQKASTTVAVEKASTTEGVEKASITEVVEKASTTEAVEKASTAQAVEKVSTTEMFEVASTIKAIETTSINQAIDEAPRTVTIEPPSTTQRVNVASNTELRSRRKKLMRKLKRKALRQLGFTTLFKDRTIPVVKQLSAQQMKVFKKRLNELKSEYEHQQGCKIFNRRDEQKSTSDDDDCVIIEEEQDLIVIDGDDDTELENLGWTYDSQIDRTEDRSQSTHSADIDVSLARFQSVLASFGSDNSIQSVNESTATSESRTAFLRQPVLRTGTTRSSTAKSCQTPLMQEELQYSKSSTENISIDTDEIPTKRLKRSIENPTNISGDSSIICINESVRDVENVSMFFEDTAPNTIVHRNDVPIYDANTINRQPVLGDDSDDLEIVSSTPITRSKSKRKRKRMDDSVIFISEEAAPQISVSNKGPDYVSLADHCSNIADKQLNTTPPRKKVKPSTSRGLLTTAERKRMAAYNTNTFNPNTEEPKSSKRMVIIDGCNIAYSHSLNKEFSVRGIEIAIEAIKRLGHEVKAVVPQIRMKKSKSSDQALLDKLHGEGYIVLTPCKSLPGKSSVSYDDRFILQLAVELDAAIISNDQYRDLLHENAAFKKVIESRVIGYSWCNDVFIMPKDPYGRHGPSLDVILNRI